MPRDCLFIFGGAIGDALLGVQLSHALAKAAPESRLVCISTRRSGFVREFLKLVPSLSYRELPPRDLRSWLYVARLLFRPHAVVFFVPFQDRVPWWWRFIARMATVMQGSIEVRCMIQARPTPARVLTLRYDPREGNLFSVVTKVIPLWGGEDVGALQPTLPEPACTEAPARPFILFHFFAGSSRRSWHVDKVRPLLEAARARYPRHEFILTCAHGEEKLAEAMVVGISNARVEISPHPSKLLCLLRQSALCVGVASGVTHIASHLSVPAVVLCNLSDPCWLPTYAPQTVMLAARAECRCKGDKTGECSVETPSGGMYRCLYFITIEEVLGAMGQKLEHSL